jgi:RNA polymerase sigma factor (TIGR02999 family)
MMAHRMDASQAASEITRLLIRNDITDEFKNNQLLSLVYTELKSIAQNKMGHERSNHTLTPTGLVHEAYLRLVNDPNLNWQSRKHFFAAAAESMRRILIDSARKKTTAKHGANAHHSPVIEVANPNDMSFNADIIDLDRALSLLEKKDEQMAFVVKLRYFSGLTVDEIALAIDVSPRTVNRLWAASRAWLIAHM